MSIKRVLFCTGQGIGNVIQCIPVIRTLKEVLGYEVDFLHMYGSYGLPKLIPYVGNWFSGKNIYNVDANIYDGKVYTGWVRHNTKKLKEFAPYIDQIKTLTETVTPVIMTRSEVDIYMDIARDLGVNEENIIWDGKCNYKTTDEKYDVVIHNGYNKIGATNWAIKSYQGYDKVVKLLVDGGFSVCSVGAKDEYIKGTVNKTGLDLLSSLGFIKNSKLFLGNDSGLYHCANALNIKNVAIFTATSILKNYDKRFHKYTTIIGREDLKCRPCQGNRGWKTCKTWECTKINPEVVVNKIKGFII